MVFEPRSEGKEGTDSEFNMSISLLNRINEIMYFFDGSMMSGKFTQAFENLQILRDEVEFCMKDDEIEEISGMEERIIYFLEKVNYNIDKTHNYIYEGMKYKVYSYPKGRKILKELLREYVRLLRKLMNKHGLIIREKGDQKLF